MTNAQLNILCACLGVLSGVTGTVGLYIVKELAGIRMNLWRIGCTADELALQKEQRAKWVDPWEAPKDEQGTP